MRRDGRRRRDFETFRLDREIADVTVFLIENGWTNSDVRELTLRQLDLFVERTNARLERIASKIKNRR
jgi:hypothetical protein